MPRGRLSRLLPGCEQSRRPLSRRESRPAHPCTRGLGAGSKSRHPPGPAGRGMMNPTRPAIHLQSRPRCGGLQRPPARRATRQPAPGSLPKAPAGLAGRGGPAGHSCPCPTSKRFRLPIPPLNAPLPQPPGRFLPLGTLPCPPSCTVIALVTARVLSDAATTHNYRPEERLPRVVSVAQLSIASAPATPYLVCADTASACPRAFGMRIASARFDL